jgi:DNA-binding ferritin-like protein
MNNTEKKQTTHSSKQLEKILRNSHLNMQLVVGSNGNQHHKMCGKIFSECHLMLNQPINS